jgi:DNA-binding transcriptional ArsR family regulator
LSNHLRILRHAKLVSGERDGRSITYRLFDDHVVAFFDQALLHLGHAQPGGD